MKNSLFLLLVLSNADRILDRLRNAETPIKIFFERNENSVGFNFDDFGEIFFESADYEYENYYDDSILEEDVTVENITVEAIPEEEVFIESLLPSSENNDEAEEYSHDLEAEMLQDAFKISTDFEEIDENVLPVENIFVEAMPEEEDFIDTLFPVSEKVEQVEEYEYEAEMMQDVFKTATDIEEVEIEEATEGNNFKVKSF